ncbi:MAG: hypothetical protein ACRCWG_11775 [Sarcina sp.]
MPILNQHADLRVMFIISNTTLCMIDGADAFIRSRGNIVVFIMRMNLIAWARLVILVFKELRIRYGNIALELVRSFIQEIGNILNLSEKNVLNEYFSRMERLDYQLNKQLNEFVDLVNKEHLLLMNELKVINSDNSSINEKVKSGIKTARYCKVDEGKIIKNKEELDKFFYE